VNRIDDYLKKIQPAKRRELERIRAIAKRAVPEAEETIAYGMPTLKYQGKPFLGFNAHAKHIGIYPYSGKVIPQLKSELRDCGTSSGALRVPLDEPIPATLLKKIIGLRLKAIQADAKPQRVSRRRASKTRGTASL
jgi:uncharacterized protein YdhG (YjbR/CyaY superfamily)